MRKDSDGNELLNRMYYKHGAYWYVYRNKWRRIGHTYNNALRGYASLQETAGTMPKLINQTYEQYEYRVKTGDLKPQTLSSYNAVKRTLLKAFQNVDPGDITPGNIQTVIKSYYRVKPNAGNRALVVLREAFELGMELGVNDFNPARQIKRKPERKRKRRLTDAEFNKIRHCAKGQLPLIMDVLYFTGQRIGDVLAIKQADISGGVIRFIQQKTGAAIDIEIGPELEKAIAAARSGPVTGLWLFSKHGKPMSYYTVQSAYKAACGRAGVADTTLHDIRAKTITDMALRGDDAQALAGHSDAKMTARYIRERVPVKVKSLDSLRVNNE